MNAKRFLVAVGVIFIVRAILGYLMHEVLLKEDYAGVEQLWRPAEEMKQGLLMLNDLIWSFLFTLIFTKGYEGKGLMEGVRYGFWIGLLITIPWAFNSYAVMPVSLSLALGWFIYGMIQVMVCGIVASLLYKEE